MKVMITNLINNSLKCIFNDYITFTLYIGIGYGRRRESQPVNSMAISLIRTYRKNMLGGGGTTITDLTNVTIFSFSYKNFQRFGGATCPPSPAAQFSVRPCSPVIFLYSTVILLKAEFQTSAELQKLNLLECRNLFR